MTLVAIGSNVNSQELNDNFSQIETRLNSIHYDVKAFEAVGDGLTDDTAKIQLAIDTAKNNGGGIVFFPTGIYLISTTLMLEVGTTSILFKGAGRRVSIITTKTLNIDMINVDDDDVVIEDLTISNIAGGTRTAGSCVKLTSGQSFTLNRCNIVGSYYGVDIINALLWTLNNSYFADPHKYGVYIKNIASPDTGDQVISGCTFDENLTADAAIRHESGGGLKVIGNKFLDHKYAYDLQVADGVVTSVLIISGNSIENQRIAGIRLGRLGTTGTYGKIDITGNQFSSFNSIIVDNGNYSTNFSGNVHSGDTTGTAITLNYGSIASISGENIYNYAKGIQLSPSTLYSKVSDNFYFNTPITVEDNASSINNVLVEHRYGHKYNVSSSTDYTWLFQLDIADNRACSIDLTLEGLVQSGTPYVRKITKLISRVTGDCTITAVADTAVGNAIDMQFETVATSGSVIIGIRRNVAGGGINVVGTIDMEIKGNVQVMNILGSQF
jgi:hypothetical protein